MKYAEKTEVSSSKSRAEIEATLERYSATKFGHGWEEGRATIMYCVNDRMIRFILPLPSRTDRKITHSAHRYPQLRSIEQQNAAYEQAVRQKWRALALAIKAKLEAVESNIATFEEEFLSYVLLPDGRTVGEHIRPQIASAYEHGEMPRLMLGLAHEA